MLFLGAFFGFLANKLLVRPLMRTREIPGVLETLSYSIPNFFEAVMGVIIVTAGLMWVRDSVGRLRFVGDRVLYGLAALLAGLYVVAQELGLHSLGGNNVVDPKDIAASVLGLVVTASLLLRYGLFLPQVGESPRSDA